MNASMPAAVGVAAFECFSGAFTGCCRAVEEEGECGPPDSPAYAPNARPSATTAASTSVCARDQRRDRGSGATAGTVADTGASARVDSASTGPGTDRARRYSWTCSIDQRRDGSLISV